MTKENEKSHIWRYFDRVNTLLQIFVALAVLIQLAWAGRGIWEFGLKATVPAWLILPTVVCSIIFGLLAGRKLTLRISSDTPDIKGKLVRKITFEYLPDPPTRHGWHLVVDDPSKESPKFNKVDDGFFGTVLDIEAQKSYYMDFLVRPAEAVGHLVEFIVKPEYTSRLYVRVKVLSKDGSNLKDVWLKIEVGRGSPKPLGQGTREWTVFISPTLIGKGWISMCINLPEQIKETFGKDGWKFDKLMGFRVRGKISLASISVYTI
jgi:hypothetical protein